MDLNDINLYFQLFFVQLLCIMNLAGVTWHLALNIFF